MECSYTERYYTLHASSMIDVSSAIEELARPCLFIGQTAHPHNADYTTPTYSIAISV